MTDYPDEGYAKRAVDCNPDEAVEKWKMPVEDQMEFFEDEGDTSETRARFERAYGYPSDVPLPKMRNPLRETLSKMSV